jgi:uncharacterized protein (TIRG00374 family)
MTRGGAVRALIGVAISIVTLYVILHNVDLAEVADILRTAAPGWLLLMLGGIVVDLLIRGLRWQRLLAPIHPVPYQRSLGYLLIGYLANNVLPARLGELVRAHYLGDREGVSRTTTLGTIVVERVIDTVVVVAVAAFAIVILGVRGLVANAVIVGLAVTALFVVTLAVLVAARRLPGAERVVAYAARWPRLSDLAGKLHGGLSVAGRPRTLFEALALSCLAWGATIVAFAAAGQSLGVQLTTAQAALLASGVALASAIPAGPGNLGTYDLAATVIAGTFGLRKETAVALAIVGHAAVLIVTSVGGAVALLRLGWARRPPTPVAEAELGG